MQGLFGAQAKERRQGVTLSAAHAHLLTEVGFLAAAAGDVVHAEPIFGALLAFRPLRAFPRVGLGVAWMNAGRHASAVSLLEAAPSDMPDEERGLLDFWRAVALQKAGRSAESTKLLQRLLESDTDASVLAGTLLGQTKK